MEMPGRGSWPGDSEAFLLQFCNAPEGFLILLSLLLELLLILLGLFLILQGLFLVLLSLSLILLYFCSHFFAFFFQPF